MSLSESLAVPPVILLIEDGQSLRPLVSRALLDAGYQVLTAADHTEASALLERSPLEPALAIVALQGSPQSSTEVAEVLTRGRAALPIIFLVRHLENPDALLPGLVLEEPLNSSTLCRVVENVLTRGIPLFSLNDDP